MRKFLVLLLSFVSMPLIASDTTRGSIFQQFDPVIQQEDSDYQTESVSDLILQPFFTQNEFEIC